jgi:hypothetical protein
MALVDLKTDLKSLKFESGLNRKPFVVKDVDQRGGRNSAIDVIGIQAAKRLDDVVRMAKLVVAKPGLTHAAKQALYTTISAAETGKLYDNAEKDILRNAADILATAVTNTAQTAVNGLGIHTFKGLLQTDGDDRQYTNTVKGPGLKSPAHSTQISQGVKKSKKLTINKADKLQYGKIDYLTKPNNSEAADMVNVNEGTQIKDDTIKFYFKILGETSDKDILLQFRAYLSTLSDSFSGQWNKTQMLGRPENFKSYNGFERNINLGFKIAAETRKDLLPLYRKLNRLASTTAPTFSPDDNQLFMRGTLVKVRVGDYLYNQLCNVENVALSWAMDYPWEVQLQGKDEDDVQVLPHVLDVSMTLGAIHEFVPTAGDTPFFGKNTSVKEGEDFKPGPDSLFQKTKAKNPDRVKNKTEFQYPDE